MDILEKKLPFVSEMLKGVGQIMLQDNIWTGLLFLAGIFYDDYKMGFAAILAAAVGTLTARILKYDEGEIAMGLYGFSATLVGVALTFMFRADALIWGAVIVGAALATVLQHMAIKNGIPVFTLPFIVVTWAIVFALHSFTAIPPADPLVDTMVLSEEINNFTASTNGFGEVIFQGSFVAGVIFFIAVFLGNPVAALYGLAGSLFGAWIALFFAEPLKQVHMGLFSFNAVLCSIAFAGTKRKDGLLVMLSSLLAVLIDIYMLKMDWSVLAKAGGVLTFPFVAGTWLTLPVKKVLYRIND
ncbi:urea transporter [Dyadobacter soli]|uniref:Urea transporter n=1 Tax=Dyadobacter soli TaxID=659014 RepID=A0A1G7Q3E2_9BACT|nr:urea transporter [Dyadobacter soli]SDF92459.1 urea transporter [Dyadobacter soli]